MQCDKCGCSHAEHTTEQHTTTEIIFTVKLEGKKISKRALAKYTKNLKEDLEYDSNELCGFDSYTTVKAQTQTQNKTALAFQSHYPPQVKTYRI